jgi:hypothetical protein
VEVVAKQSLGYIARADTRLEQRHGATTATQKATAYQVFIAKRRLGNAKLSGSSVRVTR